MSILVVLMCDTSSAQTTFAAGGENFQIERFPAQPTATPRPAVVMLHGVDGMETGSGTRIREFATRLADQGYLVLVPHYFGKADRSETLPWPKLMDRRVKAVKTYVPRVAAAVEYATQQPDAQADTLGLIGFSMGGGLAVAYAESVPAGKVAAVVDYFGYIFDPALYQNAGKLPPTLVFHNQNDLVVKVKNSQDLVAALVQHQVPHDSKIYNEQNPLKLNHPFAVGGAAATDSYGRTITWLQTYLKPAAAANGPAE